MLCLFIRFKVLQKLPGTVIQGCTSNFLMRGCKLQLDMSVTCSRATFNNCSVLLMLYFFKLHGILAGFYTNFMIDKTFLDRLRIKYGDATPPFK